MLPVHQRRELIAALGEFRETGTGELNFNCPFCIERIGKADTGFHLYVNPSKVLHNIKGWYYCHRCRVRGPLSKVVSTKEEAPHLSRWDSFVKALKNPVAALKEAKENREVKLPEDYAEILPGMQAYEYLTSRSLTKEIISTYRIGLGTKRLRDLSKEERRKYAGYGRIVFPDFDTNGDLVYWVARTYVGHAVKYKNPPHSDARDKVYNLTRASSHNEVIITEGVMSAIAAGLNAVATYGKDVTPSQVSLLARAGFSRYYVALDGDALYHTPFSNVMPPAFRLADRLLRRGKSVSLVELPYEHDPASVKDFKIRVKQATVWDRSSSIKLRMRYSTS